MAVDPRATSDHEAMDVIRRWARVVMETQAYLVQRTGNLTYVATAESHQSLALGGGGGGGGGKAHPRVHMQMDHLSCFVPGWLALGAQKAGSYLEDPERVLALADALVHTCYRMYRDMPSRLAPESSRFSLGKLRADARHNLQRPETVESLFVLWRITGNQKYREWGWDIFEAFEKHAKVPGGGYSG